MPPKKSHPTTPTTASATPTPFPTPAKSDVMREHFSSEAHALVKIKRELGKGAQARVVEIEATITPSGDSDERNFTFACAAKIPIYAPTATEKRYTMKAEGDECLFDFFLPDEEEQEDTLEPPQNIKRYLYKSITGHLNSSIDSGVLICIGRFILEDKDCLLFPLLESTLEKLLEEKGSLSRATTDQIKTNKLYVFEGLLKGLQTLDQTGYLHCDIKPENIGYRITQDKEGNQIGGYVLFDLDTAQENHEEDLFQIAGSNLFDSENPDSIQGTLLYIAPELLIGSAVANTETDIWSAGNTLLKVCGLKTVIEEIMTKTPQDGNGFIRATNVCLQLRDEAERQPASENLTAENARELLHSKRSFDLAFQYIISKMCEFNPENRPTIEALSACFNTLKEILQNELGVDRLPESLTIYRDIEGTAQQKKPISPLVKGSLLREKTVPAATTQKPTAPDTENGPQNN